MDRTELLVLHGSVFYPTPIEILNADSFDQACWFGFEIPPVNGENLAVKSLLRLARDGLVEIGSNEEGHFVVTPPTEIVEWERQNFPGLEYRLTPSGGAAWEMAAKVDWNLFLQTRSGVTPIFSSLVTYQSVDKEFMERHTKPFLTAWGKRVTFVSEFEVLEPWKVSYWKEIPRAYQLQIGLSEDGSAPIKGYVPRPDWCDVGFERRGTPKG